ncbi:hypothetical protein K503DRAFT_792881 [Rhizopogon vinicolor AM-OR11-026]|uniref:Uncharacterized protein n=1 Tax=Rhizopogon vinicolor AM-OR11-026 TaxID=1314800 RepID=A0A1B7MYA2_9AGAM|nr:hypothetical protein K503DRAFT_792881 [Rhizopogon vinicolor AM-OR11-026]
MAIRKTLTPTKPIPFTFTTNVDTQDLSKDHELQTAPLITREAYIAAGYKKHSTQYGVMGETLSIQYDVSHSLYPRLYINTNAPFSAVVCGAQDSGKSHTVSVLLENMLLPKLQEIGSLEQPLAGLVLHFGEGSRPSEAAWVGVPTGRGEGVRPPKVRVFVSKSSLNTMKAIYAPLGKEVEVTPLLFNEAGLDAQAFLSMIAIGSSDSVPLYIQIVLNILRELGEMFSYGRFLTTFNPVQSAGLEQRLTLLNSFMESTPCHRFAAGQWTIVDLSDPFIDPASVCGLFEIVTRLFVRAEVETGKVLVMKPTRGVSGLTKALLTLTREQRHLAICVIISTQEPTVVPPVLLDLCTVAIMHRFSSPAWWDHLARHITADVSADAAFDTVVKLQTGEAIVLAPPGLGVFPQNVESVGPRTTERDAMPALKLGRFGRRYVLMKTRAHVTKDGGASVLVIPAEESESEEEVSEPEESD